MTRAPELICSCYLESAPALCLETIQDRILPDTLARAAGSHPDSAPDSGFTFGDYFKAAVSYLEKEDFLPLRSAVFQSTGLDVAVSEIRKIHICLKKHGAYYHPAKIELSGDRVAASFVLNVAVSDIGKQLLPKEVQTLKRLHRFHSEPWIPRVFDSGTISTEKGPVGLFLGEWFEGYHEFHLERNPKTDRVAIQVWDETQGPYFLEKTRCSALYRQMGRLLTLYYHPETFEEIHPWHHASGDFVVKTEGEALSVRLITVRNYRPLFRRDPENRNRNASVEEILHALLFFFLKLSVQIRLDRVSGTGPWVWAENGSVGPAVQGFWDALEEKGKLPGFPAPLADCFAAYLASVTLDEARDLLKTMVKQENRIVGEKAFLLRQIDAHAEQLMAALQKPILLD